ncbi:hypothetical protein LZ24_02500 [Desulfobotulus alkaliphilus]|uniref:Uncharacterized protein n=1 Tax=Desulfobotulus alkaliphilus TaxID=622671 RepID=A0A562RHN0_9BACT|nr:hypothetical protein LZ24_02500 [Desulfobotulus alkaliphilus]
MAPSLPHTPPRDRACPGKLAKCPARVQVNTFTAFSDFQLNQNITSRVHRVQVTSEIRACARGLFYQATSQAKTHSSLIEIYLDLTDTEYKRLKIKEKQKCLKPSYLDTGIFQKLFNGKAIENKGVFYVP